MRNLAKKFRPLFLAALLALGLAALVWAVEIGPSEGQNGVLHNCPQVDKWALAVWDGDDGTDVEEAFATCAPKAVAAAYYIDPDTQLWSRWFAGRPGVSNLLALNNMQGVIALGGTAATATPTPSATPPPTATPTPAQPSARPFPDTTVGIHVFNDQLAASSMTEAQLQFAASHYAGSQKLLRADTQRLRQYNPDFLVLHYRLGLSLGYREIGGDCQPSGPHIEIIEGDQWVQEWPAEATVQDSWFFEQDSARVLNCDWGWYLMEVDDPAWREYWSGEVLRQLEANENDGLFADSYSVPNYLGADRYDPSLPEVDESFEDAWALRIADFTDFMLSRLAGNYYFIPNVGAWVTTRDPTDYSAVDGMMIEGFAMWEAGEPLEPLDWELQMNRILSLTQADKIIIAQTYVGPEDVDDRLFALGSYLLVKGSRSYLNLDMGLDPEWFPEYEMPIGSPEEPLPEDVSELLDPAWGVYARRYTGGLVLVNPDTTERALTLDGTYHMAQPQGGGIVPTDGQLPAAWGLAYTPVTDLTLGPRQAAVLLSTAP